VIFCTQAQFASQIEAQTLRASGCLVGVAAQTLASTVKCGASNWPPHLYLYQRSEGFDPMIYARATLPFISAVLLSCALPVSQAQPIGVQDLGDDEMNCQALYDNIKQMDGVIAANTGNTSTSHSTQSATNRAMQEAARENRSSEFAQFSSLFGRIVGGQLNPQQATQDPAQLRAQAHARKQHLTSLFRSKKCKVSTLRK
jgi:hypothetical protein